MEEAAREGFDVIDTAEERDVSGGNKLDKRPGLKRAVEAIESGEAEVILVAWQNRLARKTRVEDGRFLYVTGAGAR